MDGDWVNGDEATAARGELGCRGVGIMCMCPGTYVVPSLLTHRAQRSTCRCFILAQDFALVTVHSLAFTV